MKEQGVVWSRRRVQTEVESARVIEEVTHDVMMVLDGTTIVDENVIRQIIEDQEALTPRKEVG
jgi:hypothetical protein